MIKLILLTASLVGTAAFAHDVTASEETTAKSPRVIVKTIRKNADGTTTEQTIESDKLPQMAGCEEHGMSAVKSSDTVSAPSQETDVKMKTHSRLLICAKPGASSLEHLKAARARLVDDKSLSDDIKKQVLESLDKAITEQSSKK